MPSPKLIAIVAVTLMATVAVSSLLVVGGSPNFEYTCDNDGNFTLRNTSSGVFIGASWNVEEYYGNKILSNIKGNTATWNDNLEDNSERLHVFKVTLNVRTYAGIERSVSKDAVSYGFEYKLIEWKFNGNDYSIMISIKDSDFTYYVDKMPYADDSFEGFNGRAPGGAVNQDLVEEFVINGTSTVNGAFELIIEQFEDQFTKYGLSDQMDRIDCIMMFVQTIGYVTDLASTGNQEYWKYPTETLYAQGDCEDLSMLTMSLLRAIQDLPTALFIFWNIDGTGQGHAMAAVNMTTVPDPPMDHENISTGWYTDKANDLIFYACETTAFGWEVDEVPPQLSDVGPDVIVEIPPA